MTWKHVAMALIVMAGFVVFGVGVSQDEIARQAHDVEMGKLGLCRGDYGRYQPCGACHEPEAQ